MPWYVVAWPSLTVALFVIPLAYLGLMDLAGLPAPGVVQLIPGLSPNGVRLLSFIVTGWVGSSSVLIAASVCLLLRATREMVRGPKHD